MIPTPSLLLHPPVPLSASLGLFGPTSLASGKAWQYWPFRFVGGWVSSPTAQKQAGPSPSLCAPPQDPRSPPAPPALCLGPLAPASLRIWPDTGNQPGRAKTERSGQNRENKTDLVLPGGGRQGDLRLGLSVETHIAPSWQSSLEEHHDFHWQVSKLGPRAGIPQLTSDQSQTQTLEILSPF